MGLLRYPFNLSLAYGKEASLRLACDGFGDAVFEVVDKMQKEAGDLDLVFVGSTAMRFSFWGGNVWEWRWGSAGL